MNRIIIRHIANSVKGSFLTVLTGEELRDAEITFEGLRDGKTYIAEVVNSADHTVTCRVPDSAFQAYRVTARKNGQTSEPYHTNIPEVKWVQGDALYQGQPLRIFGQGFVNIDRYEERKGNENRGYGGALCDSGCTVTLKNEAGVSFPLPVNEASNYQIYASVPNSIPTGDYTLYVDAQCGMASVGTAVTVAKKTVWPDTVFNVLDYGARAVPLTDVSYENLFDNTEAFQRALDAAGANGGGVVFVPNGRYCFKGELRVPRYTRLVGEDVKRTWIELPKGTRGVNGWGTEEEGSKIKVFIGGQGDFSVENFNICSVYSPIIIGAPVIEGEPILGDDKFNRIPCYCNLIDQKKDADNVSVLNCYLVQEPTYLTHHKQKNDTFFIDEYDRTDPTGPIPNANIASIANVWTAIAIKGVNTTVRYNNIQGGGTCVALMGAQNSDISHNELYCGDLANCIGMFSTSYNPNDRWQRTCQNIIIEHNVLDIATKLNRGVMWIMQDNCRFYIAENDIKPFFWHSDAEGFCFHLWGEHLATKCQGNCGPTVRLNMDVFKKQYEGFLKEHTDQNGDLIPHTLCGGNAAVVGGKGTGQLFRIVDNTADSVILDHEPDCALDESTCLNISDCEKFFDTLLIHNTVNDLGRGVYLWGPSWGSIMDGNLCSRNSGVLMEDLSHSYPDCGLHWTFAGEYFNQIINNRLIMPCGFSTNFGVIGVKGGEFPSTTLSMIIRGNVAEDDAVITALPLADVENGLNYEGVVIENNLSRNCETGIMVSPAVSVTLKDNVFENVKKPVEGAGKYAVDL